jgi:hypothetical protein
MKKYFKSDQKEVTTHPSTPENVLSIPLGHHNVGR